MGWEMCSAMLKGRFLWLNGCVPLLIWPWQNVPARESGNLTPAICGVWACLVFWFFICLFYTRLEMGLGTTRGEAQKAALGTLAVPMEIRGSSLRLVYSFGCCWRLPLWQTTARLWRFPPLKILALSLIIRIAEPQHRFPLKIQKDSRKPLPPLSCLWKEVTQIQNAYNKSPRKTPQSLLDVLPSKWAQHWHITRKKKAILS